MISTQFHVDYLLLIYHLLHRSTKRIYTRYRLQPCIVSKIFISSRSSMLNLSRSKFYLKEIVYERVTCTFDVIKFSIQTSNSNGWFKRYFAWYRILIPLMGIVIKFSSFCRFACRHASSIGYEIIKDFIAIIQVYISVRLSQLDCLGFCF